MTVSIPLPFWEAPVAYSMVSLVGSDRTDQYWAFKDYLCLWSAFNAIYVTIAAHDDRSQVAWFIKQDDGSQVLEQVGPVRIARVRTKAERTQIGEACKLLQPGIRDSLIRHSSTHFFVYRSPRWRFELISEDALGQKLNGVINVGRTIDRHYPVWSPIDTAAYERYMSDRADAGDAEVLANQLVFLLYTVRNNLAHGGKRADDASDREVVEKALPLLKTLVDYFLESNEGN